MTHPGRSGFVCYVSVFYSGSQYFMCSLLAIFFFGRKKAGFKLSKVTLGSEAEGNKTKEMNYYSLNLNEITFVLLPAASEPSMNFSNLKLASPFQLFFIK